MSNKLVISVDIGTSSTRAIVFNTSGMPVEGLSAHLSHSMVIDREGRAELDPELLFRNTITCLDEVIKLSSPLSPEFLGVGISCLWHSVLGVDDDFEAVTPLITWADRRSAKETEELKNIIDIPSYYKRAGVPIHTSFLPAKIKCYKKQHPDSASEIKLWLSIGEYILLRLFGETRTTHSMASGTGLYNYEIGSWDKETLKCLELSEDNLAKITEEPLTGLLPSFQRILPSLADISFFPPYGDGAMNSIGSGCDVLSRLSLMIGTSAVMRGPIEKASAKTVPEGLWRYNITKDDFLIGGAMSNGGNVIEWLCKLMSLDNYTEWENRLSKHASSCTDLLFLPFLFGTRSPYWNSFAFGEISGIDFNTKPEDFFISAMEGIAFGLKEIYEKLCLFIPDHHEIIISGGALLRSPTWMQILSNILEKNLAVSSVLEASARGVALMVLRHLGIRTNAMDYTPLTATIEPQPQSYIRYKTLKANREILLERISPLWKTTQHQ